MDHLFHCPWSGAGLKNTESQDLVQTWRVEARASPKTANTAP